MTTIQVEADTLSVITKQTAYSGAKNYYKINFQFSLDWDAYTTKHAIFIKLGKYSEDVIIPASGEVVIPNTLLEHETVLAVGCYGINNDIRRTTNLIELSIKKGSYQIEEKPTPSPDIFQQYIDQLINYSDIFNSDLTTTIPQGGFAGQVLTKNTESDFDVDWKDTADNFSADDTTINNTSPLLRYSTLVNQKQINEKISDDLDDKADLVEGQVPVTQLPTYSSTDITVSSTDPRFNGLTTQKQVNEKLSDDFDDKADLVEGQVPVTQLPTYSSTDITVSSTDPRFTDLTTQKQVNEKLSDDLGDNLTRELLTANRTYYLDPVNGNDSNNGTTLQTPFKSIQYAIDEAAKLDISIYSVVIDLWSASGAGTVTYTLTTNIIIKGLIGSGSLEIIGNSANQDSVIISSGGNNCFINQQVSQPVRLSDFQICGTSNEYGLFIKAPIALVADGLHFKDLKYCIRTSISAGNITLSNTNNSSKFSGSPVNVFRASPQGQILLLGGTLDTGALTSVTQFVYCDLLGVVRLVSTTVFSTTAITGSQYVIKSNAVLFLSGKTLPGLTSGTTETGGQVI